jgi:hypothetical protein
MYSNLLQTELPPELQSVIGTEQLDFSVKAKRNQPASKSIGIILFGTLWTAFTSIFVYAFLGPLFVGKETNFKVDGVPTTGSWDNFQPMIMPTIIISVFVLVGLGMLFWGFYSIFKKGGYFVGTKSRLIKFNNGNISSFDWEQFSGNIDINTRKGDIALQLRTGKMVSRKNRSDEYVPDVIYISGVDDVLDIEQKCRKRIKENDPTPPIGQ